MTRGRSPTRRLVLGAAGGALLLPRAARAQMGRRRIALLATVSRVLMDPAIGYGDEVIE
jgi:hypothetical protein